MSRPYWDNQFMETEYERNARLAKCRHQRSDERRGRDANLAGKPRDSKQNIDWLLGWDNAQDDRRLDED